MTLAKSIKSAGLHIPAGAEIVNDKHSQLNQTVVKTRVVPTSSNQLVDIVKGAISTGDKICVAGGRHAMGGQQFLRGGFLVDTAKLDQTFSMDEEKGLVEVAAGMCWPALIAFLGQSQKGREHPWTIRQKQTGCDSLSIGGALSANIHGRGLRHAPFVTDVEDFTIVTGDGHQLRCSRDSNSELFGLAIGGYGLFGLITSATLRLTPRLRLRRCVELVSARDAVAALEKRASLGATHGDFQFDIDDRSENFLQRGILSTYSPVSSDSEKQADQKELSLSDWRELTYLAHSDKKAAFRKYVKHYLATDGQLYWSDMFQLSTYIDDYHADVDRRLPKACPGTELITELYVPRLMLGDFLEEAAHLLRELKANVIYGTVRLIDADTETFLPWATRPWACVVFNLHVEHSDIGLAAARRCFTSLIDLALRFSGSFYLTYHRFAVVNQLLACYPQMPQFLKLKQKYDPAGLFVSDWYNQICSQFLASSGAAW